MALSPTPTLRSRRLEIVGVVSDMCIIGLKASDVALKTGGVRQAVTKLLKIGPDILAEDYKIVPAPK
jgi:hypothetical protein